MGLKRFIFGFAVTATVCACQNGQNHNNKMPVDSIVVPAKTASFSFAKDTDSLESAIKNYLALKNSLVKSDFAGVQKAAQILEKMATTPSLDSIGILAKNIALASDIKTQRLYFTNLSEQLIALAKEKAMTEGTIYVQRCPMANNGDGGTWLSTEKNILNPYYGDEMLECGEVIETIGK